MPRGRPKGSVDARPRKPRWDYRLAKRLENAGVKFTVEGWFCLRCGRMFGSRMEDCSCDE